MDDAHNQSTTIDCQESNKRTKRKKKIANQNS